MKLLLPTERTMRKTLRDFAVIALPAILIWVIGHPADLQGFGLDAAQTAKVIGYATGGLALWRWLRDARGTGPTV